MIRERTIARLLREREALSRAVDKDATTAQCARELCAAVGLPESSDWVGTLGSLGLDRAPDWVTPEPTQAERDLKDAHGQAEYQLAVDQYRIPGPGTLLTLHWPLLAAGQRREWCEAAARRDNPALPTQEERDLADERGRAAYDREQARYGVGTTWKPEPWAGLSDTVRRYWCDYAEQHPDNGRQGGC